ncbi:hypothetical protein [Streptomyces sp. NBC_01579]|uniref:hypothetical protein n=1 Tax=Streptomyces sp. NBC_01579 TaxID=2975885 RepID=UPI003864E7F5
MRPLPDLRQVRHDTRLRATAPDAPPSEQTLALDAAERGWDRERHRCTSLRIEKLLADLNEPLDGPNESPEVDRLELSS